MSLPIVDPTLQILDGSNPCFFVNGLIRSFENGTSRFGPSLQSLGLLLIEVSLLFQFLAICQPGIPSKHQMTWIGYRTYV